MSGKPRRAGAVAVLQYFGVTDADRLADVYGERKQARLVELIDEGSFHAFPDAVRFALRLKQGGIRIAAASSSKNARRFLERISVGAVAGELGLRATRWPRTRRAFDPRQRCQRAGLPARQARPHDLPGRGRGARLPARALLCHRGCGEVGSRQPGPVAWVRLRSAALTTRNDWWRRGPTLVVKSLDLVDLSPGRRHAGDRAGRTKPARRILRPAWATARP